MKFPISFSKKTFVFAAVVVVLGLLAIQQVFSLTQMRRLDGAGLLLREQSLLLTSRDGLLPKKEAWKLYSKVRPLIVAVHEADRSDSLYSISSLLHVSASALRSTNNLEDPALRPDQQILIQNRNGMAHLAENDEPLEKVIQTYLKLGAKREKILANNPLDEITYLKDGQLMLRSGAALWIPEAYRSFPYLLKPIPFARISSRFGIRRHPILKTRLMHSGYDFAAPYGAPVYASQAGVIIAAEERSGYGLMVDIRHPSITTRYGHLSAIYVHPGQKVNRRQMIGRVGSTGLSTGPHLHFEVRRNSDGKALRPGKYLF